MPTTGWWRRETRATAVTLGILTMIRKATLDDADEIAEVYIGSRRTHVSFAPLAHNEAGIRDWIRNILIPKGNTVVSEEDGVLTGMMATSEDEGGSWIDQLYVRSDLTGQGIGEKLLRKALAELKRPIRLHTFQKNDGAKRFYESKGFRPIEFTDGSGNQEKCPDVLYVLET